MRLIRILILVLIAGFFHSNLLFAQKVKIAGKVTDTSGKAIVNATVSIIDNKTNSITAYTITNKEGNFTISIDSANAIISISCIGYTKLEKPVSPNTQPVTYRLQETQTLLPTIEVKNSPVSVQGDTTNYTAGFFSNKQDRVIGDVLARLPGIEIDANGLITYNGKPISNYYIDGLDLLGTKYNIANQNIPADLVDKIQLLNNHQAIKALDSFTNANATAINIKLKAKAKNRFISKAKIGVGASPFIWDNEITTLNFKKNIQLIGAYKNNNSGTYLYNEIADNFVVKQLGEENDNISNVKLLNLISLPSVNLHAGRYTFNNAHLLHFNILTLFKNKGQLKLNVSQYLDNNTANGSSSTSIFLPNDTINFKEVYTNNNKENKFKTELNYTINTKKYYLNNLLTYKNEHTAETGNIETIQPVLQKLSSTTNNISNEFVLNKAKRKTLFSISSKLNYTVNPQQLAVLPGSFTAVFNSGADFPELIQKTNLRNLSTNTAIAAIRKKPGFQYESKLGIETSNIRLQSGFLAPPGNSTALTTDSLTNNLSWQRIKPYMINTLRFTRNKRTAEITIPAEANFITQKNRTTSETGIYKRIFLNPRLDLTIPLTSKLELQLGVVKQTTIKSIIDTYNGYILTNYRTLKQNDSIIPIEKLTNFKGSFAYKNPLTGLFFYFTCSYAILRKNLLSDNVYNNSLTTSRAIQKWNNQNSLYFTGYLNKYVLSAKTNFSVIYIHAAIKSLQLLQNSETQISAVKNELRLKASVNRFSWGNLETSVSLQTTKSKLLGLQKTSARIKNTSIQNNTKIYLFLTPKFSASINTDYYNFTNTQSTHANYFFLDMGLRYKFNHIDIETTITNITNNKEFNAALLTKNTNQEYHYKIRPVNALLKIYFSF